MVAPMHLPGLGFNGQGRAADGVMRAAHAASTGGFSVLLYRHIKLLPLALPLAGNPLVQAARFSGASQPSAYGPGGIPGTCSPGGDCTERPCRIPVPDRGNPASAGNRQTCPVLQHADCPVFVLPREALRERPCGSAVRRGSWPVLRADQAAWGQGFQRLPRLDCAVFPAGCTLPRPLL